MVQPHTNHLHITNGSTSYQPPAHNQWFNLQTNHLHTATDSTITSTICTPPQYWFNTIPTAGTSSQVQPHINHLHTAAGSIIKSTTSTSPLVQPSGPLLNSSDNLFIQHNEL
jgi:hypothetical protein